MMWIPGRQGGSYSKFKVIEWKFIDCWLIKYAPFYTMPLHTDKVKGKRHIRMNIVLKGNGRFQCRKTILNIRNTIIIFRPDLYHHRMINGGYERLVLSIGFVW